MKEATSDRAACLHPTEQREGSHSEADIGRGAEALWVVLHQALQPGGRLERRPARVLVPEHAYMGLSEVSIQLTWV